MGPRPHLSLCACKTTRLTSESLVSMGPSLHLCFLHAKLRLYDQNYRSLWVPALICGFCIQNSEFRIRITSLYGSQTSPVDLCIQNNVISTRITSLYGSQPSFVVFACKTATLGTELQVSLGPRLHLWFLSFKTATLALVSMGLSLHLWFCAFKSASFAAEILVSLDPSPPLWLLQAKQRL